MDEHQDVITLEDELPETCEDDDSDVIVLSDDDDEDCSELLCDSLDNFDKFVSDEVISDDFLAKRNSVKGNDSSSCNSQSSLGLVYHPLIPTERTSLNITKDPQQLSDSSASLYSEFESLCENPVAGDVLRMKEVDTDISELSSFQTSVRTSHVKSISKTTEKSTDSSKLNIQNESLLVQANNSAKNNIENANTSSPNIVNADTLFTGSISSEMSSAKCNTIQKTEKFDSNIIAVNSKEDENLENIIGCCTALKNKGYKTSSIHKTKLHSVESQLENNIISPDTVVANIDPRTILGNKGFEERCLVKSINGSKTELEMRTGGSETSLKKFVKGSEKDGPSLNFSMSETHRKGDCKDTVLDLLMPGNIGTKNSIKSKPISMKKSDKNKAKLKIILNKLTVETETRLKEKMKHPEKCKVVKKNTTDKEGQLNWSKSVTKSKPLNKTFLGSALEKNILDHNKELITCPDQETVVGKTSLDSETNLKTGVCIETVLDTEGKNRKIADMTENAEETKPLLQKNIEEIESIKKQGENLSNILMNCTTSCTSENKSVLREKDLGENSSKYSLKFQKNLKSKCNFEQQNVMEKRRYPVSRNNARVGLESEKSKIYPKIVLNRCTSNSDVSEKNSDLISDTEDKNTAKKKVKFICNPKELRSIVTIVKNIVKTKGLEPFVKNKGLEPFVKTKGLEPFVKNKGLEPFVKNKGLEPFVKNKNILKVKKRKISHNTLSRKSIASSSISSAASASTDGIKKSVESNESVANYFVQTDEITEEKLQASLNLKKITRNRIKMDENEVVKPSSNVKHKYKITVIFVEKVKEITEMIKEPLRTFVDESCQDTSTKGDELDKEISTTSVMSRGKFAESSRSNQIDLNELTHSEVTNTNSKDIEDITNQNESSVPPLTIGSNNLLNQSDILSKDFLTFKGKWPKDKMKKQVGRPLKKLGNKLVYIEKRMKKTAFNDKQRKLISKNRKYILEKNVCIAEFGAESSSCNNVVKDLKDINIKQKKFINRILFNDSKCSKNMKITNQKVKKKKMKNQNMFKDSENSDARDLANQIVKKKKMRRKIISNDLDNPENVREVFNNSVIEKSPETKYQNASNSLGKIENEGMTDLDDKNVMALTNDKLKNFKNTVVMSESSVKQLFGNQSNSSELKNSEDAEADQSVQFKIKTQTIPNASEYNKNANLGLEKKDKSCDENLEDNQALNNKFDILSSNSKLSTFDTSNLQNQSVQKNNVSLIQKQEIIQSSKVSEKDSCTDSDSVENDVNAKVNFLSKIYEGLGSRTAESREEELGNILNMRSSGEKGEDSEETLVYSGSQNIQRLKRRSLKSNAHLKQEVQCCGHWFPSRKIFIRHLIENSKNEVDSLHTAKLIDLDMHKCAMCSIWLSNINIKRHMKVHDIASNNESINSISSKNAGDRLTYDSEDSLVPQASTVAQNGHLQEEIQTPRPKSKKKYYLEYIKCDIGSDSDVFVSSVEDIPRFLKPSLILQRYKGRLKKKIVKKKKKLLDKRYVDLLNEDTGDNCPTFKKNGSDLQIDNKVIVESVNLKVTDAIPSFSDPLEKMEMSNVNGLRDQNQDLIIKKKNKDQIMKNQVQKKSKKLPTSIEFKDDTLQGNLMNNKIKKKLNRTLALSPLIRLDDSLRTNAVIKNKILKKSNPALSLLEVSDKNSVDSDVVKKKNGKKLLKKSLSAFESKENDPLMKKDHPKKITQNKKATQKLSKVAVIKPVGFAEIKSINKNGYFETPTAKCKEPLKTRRLSCESNVKKYSVKYKNNKNVRNSIEHYVEGSTVKYRRGRGRGRRRKVGFHSSGSSEGSSDESDSSSSSNFENEISSKEDFQENENIPTVELDLFTLSSLNEDMSVLLIDPKNHNFKVMASMDAIFVGDSALSDVTNQMSYVTCDTNVVYISPNHFLFPDISDSEDIPLEEKTTLGIKNRNLRNKPVIIKAANKKSRKKVLDDNSQIESNDKENAGSSIENNNSTSKGISGKGTNKIKLKICKIPLQVSSFIGLPPMDIEETSHEPKKGTKIETISGPSKKVDLGSEKKIEKVMEVDKRVDQKLGTVETKEIVDFDCKKKKHEVNDNKNEAEDKMDIGDDLENKIDIEDNLDSQILKIKETEKENIDVTKDIVKIKNVDTAKNNSTNLENFESMERAIMSEKTEEDTVKIYAHSEARGKSIQKTKEENSTIGFSSDVIVIKTSTGRGDIEKSNSQSINNSYRTALTISTTSTTSKISLVNSISPDKSCIRTPLNQEQKSISNILFDANKNDAEEFFNKTISPIKTPLFSKSFFQSPDSNKLHEYESSNEVVEDSVISSIKDLPKKNLFPSIPSHSVINNAATTTITTTSSISRSLGSNFSNIASTSGTFSSPKDSVLVPKQCFTPVKISTDSQVVVATAKIIPSQEEIEDGVCLEEMLDEDLEALLASSDAGHNNTSTNSEKVESNNRNSICSEDLNSFLNFNSDISDILESALLSSDILDKSKHIEYPELNLEQVRNEKVNETLSNTPNVMGISPVSFSLKSNQVSPQNTNPISPLHSGQVSSHDNSNYSISSASPSNHESMLSNHESMLSSHESMLLLPDVVDISSEADTSDSSDVEICGSSYSGSPPKPFDFKAVVQGKNLWNTPLICLSSPDTSPVRNQNIVPKLEPTSPDGNAALKHINSSSSEANDLSFLYRADKGNLSSISPDKDTSKVFISPEKDTSRPPVCLERESIKQVISPEKSTSKSLISPKKISSKSPIIPPKLSPVSSKLKTPTKPKPATVMPNLSGSRKKDNLKQSVFLEKDTSTPSVCPGRDNVKQIITSKSSISSKKITTKPSLDVQKSDSILSLNKLPLVSSKSRLKTPSKSKPDAVTPTKSLCSINKTPLKYLESTSSSSKSSQSSQKISSKSSKSVEKIPFNYKDPLRTPKKIPRLNKTENQDLSALTASKEDPTMTERKQKSNEIQRRVLNSSKESKSDDSFCENEFKTSLENKSAPLISHLSSESLKMRICVKDFSKDALFSGERGHKHKKKKKHRRKRERKLEKLKNKNLQSEINLQSNLQIKTENEMDNPCDIGSFGSKPYIKVEVPDDLPLVECKKEPEDIYDTNQSESNISENEFVDAPIFPLTSKPLVVKHFESLVTNTSGSLNTIDNTTLLDSKDLEPMKTPEVDNFGSCNTNKFSGNWGNNISGTGTVFKSSKSVKDDRSWHSRGSKLKAKVMITDQQKGITNSFVGDDLKPTKVSFSNPTSKSRKNIDPIKTKDIRNYFTPKKPSDQPSVCESSMVSPINEMSTSTSSPTGFSSPPFSTTKEVTKPKRSSVPITRIPKNAKRKHPHEDIRQYFSGRKSERDLVSFPKKTCLEIKKEKDEEEENFDGFEDDLNNYSHRHSKLLQEYVDVLHTNTWFESSRYPVPVDQLCDWDDTQLNIALFEKG